MFSIVLPAPTLRLIRPFLPSILLRFAPMNAQTAGLTARTDSRLSGMTIGQLVLFQTTIAEEPQKLSGTYVGPVYPEAPTLRQPGQALDGICLEKYRHPLYGRISQKNMTREVQQKMSKMDPAGKANVAAVIRILQDNGALPPDNPASRIFSK